MKHLLTILCLATLCFSCQDRRIGGITIEVEGTVFTDSTETEPLVGAEVILLEDNSPIITLILFGNNFEVVDQAITDSAGNYSLTTTSEKDMSYFVWLKPDIFHYASPQKNRINLSERRPNTVDLFPEDLVPVSLVISSDSLSDQNLEKFAGRFILDAYHTYRGGEENFNRLDFTTAIFHESDMTWSGDTIIPLYVDTTYTLDIELFPWSTSTQSSFDLYDLFWKGSLRYLEPKDTLEINLQRHR